MKQTLSYASVQSALAAQMTLRVEGIDADGPGERDEEGHYHVSWKTDHPLNDVHRGFIIRRYQPDGADFNRLQVDPEICKHCNAGIIPGSSLHRCRLAKIDAPSQCSEPD